MKCLFVPLVFLCLFVPEQIENIDACLSFLAAKGINIQGLSAEGESGLCKASFETSSLDCCLGAILTSVWARVGD